MQCLFWFGGEKNKNTGKWRATYERNITRPPGKGAWDLNNSDGEITSVKEAIKEGKI